MHRTTPTQPPVTAVLDERLATTSVCLAVNYGARRDPAGMSGLAHVLEHALMAAPGPGGTSFSEHVERLGGHANAETGMELMLFYARVHADDADDVSARLLAATFDPQWTAECVRTERDVVLSEMAAAEADDSDVVQDRFLAQLFPGHPLGRPVGGTRGEIEALDLPSVADGYDTVFRPSPMHVFVVGPRVPSTLDASVATTPLPAVTTDAPMPPPPPSNPTVTWPDGYGWAAIGGRSTTLTAPDRHDFEVLSQLLGGSSSSLLYRKLRNEKRLTYMFHAWHRGYVDTGAWRVLVGIEKGKGDAVLDTVREALTELADQGPRPADLAAARMQAKMRLILNREQPLEHARLLAQRTFAGTLDWSVEQELAALDTVDDAGVRAAAARIVTDLLTVVSPEA